MSNGDIQIGLKSGILRAGVVSYHQTGIVSKVVYPKID
jgi:hypothetical protein